ncbi:hypothetical protein D9M68_872740 [compost metagenome]
MERVDRGDAILEPDEDQRADHGAVELAGAAEDQHDQRFGGHIEREAIEPDDLGGDGRERAAEPGDGACNCVHFDQGEIDRRAHGPHADRVLLDAAAEHAEGRANDDAQDDEDQEQQHDGHDEGGAAEQIEAEHAE